ncbi:hypothetical protein ACJRO7_032263 [Eucalyptus globulus]|uniref:Disease resistance R13L4/SHOC-2-like LRR domain-containing protein n=1 Tax=Eucalyptus globulus TaxID=34317 RepID=A0ABD3JHC3_EUCGL
MKNLKVLDLANCQCLRRTPNFFAHSNLERLILSRCESLMEIDRSICQLKRLVFLDVSYCWQLQRLPTELGGLARLKYLSLRNCESLKRLPSTIGNLKALTKLDISCMSIKELPDSIGKLKNLKVVKLQESDISKIHDAFWMMKKLEKIKIVGKKYPLESFYVEIGDCIYKNKSLRILRLGQVRIHAIPRLPKSLIELKLWELHMDTCPDISNLTNLKVLYLSFRPRNCDGKSKGLREEPIPRWIGNLSKLESLTLLFHWETSSWTDCYLSHPRRLPRLPPSLSSIRVEGCDSLCSMDLSNLRKLSSLWISHSAVAEIQGLGCLKNLRDLVLHHLKLAMLPDLSKLNKLRLIRVRECGNLVEIQGELPRFLDRLEIYLSPFLQQLPDLFSLMGKTDVEISWCNQVLEDAVMDRHRLLLRGFRQMQILPDLSNLNELKFLQVENCGNLVEIQGELPQSLEVLRIESCESLQNLPDLSSLKGLRKVTIRRCRKLVLEEICQLCSQKSLEFVGEDNEYGTLHLEAS